MTRLTDEQIARAGRICTRDDSDTDDLIELTSLVLPMLVEIRQSRAAALTGMTEEELAALRRFVADVRATATAMWTPGAHAKAFAILDRLLAKGAV